MTTVGVLGGAWRGRVSGCGTVVPIADRAPELRWWVVAEDRVHDPEHEQGVRQRCIAGTPVVETRLHVPGGDVVQRVYAVADGGGITVVEVENESPRAVAVGFAHGQLLSTRPPTPADDGSVTFPLGHRAVLRVGVSHRGDIGALPERVADAAAVARGWCSQIERASRLVLPEPSWCEAVASARCAVALGGPDDIAHDAAGHLLGIAELVRMGDDAQEWVAETVTAAERLARAARTCGLDWDGSEALAAAGRILAAAQDRRAAADAEVMLERLGGGGSGAPQPATLPDAIRSVAWVETRLARPETGGCVLLPDGHMWLGADWEAHHLPAGPRSQLSVALRWHGSRPALLWEVHGEPVALRGGADASGWHSADPRGETLWPEPVSRGRDPTAGA